MHFNAARTRWRRREGARVSARLLQSGKGSLRIPATRVRAGSLRERFVFDESARGRDVRAE